MGGNLSGSCLQVGFSGSNARLGLSLGSNGLLKGRSGFGNAGSIICHFQRDQKVARFHSLIIGDMHFFDIALHFRRDGRDICADIGIVRGDLEPASH